MKPETYFQLTQLMLAYNAIPIHSAEPGKKRALLWIIHAMAEIAHLDPDTGLYWDNFMGTMEKWLSKTPASEHLEKVTNEVFALMKKPQ
jgi:hypothetical protein